MKIRIFCARPEISSVLFGISELDAVHPRSLSRRKEKEGQPEKIEAYTRSTREDRGIYKVNQVGQVC